MNKRWLMWISLLTGAGSLALFGDKTPAGLAQPARSAAAETDASPERVAALRPPETAAPAGPVKRGEAVEAPEALVPRDVLVPPRSASQAGNPFAAASWTPRPAPAPVVAPPPPPPPAAPPLPYTVLGKKHEGAAWEVYLGRGDQVLIATVGATLEATYRVDRIQPPSMSLTYLPLGQTQPLSIGEPQ